MANTKSKTSKPKTAKAAKAETEPEPEPKTLSFKGLELTLPAELPETLLFDFVALEESEQTNDPMPVFRILSSIIGPAQFVEVRNALNADKIGPEDIAPLVREVFEEFGLTVGES